MVLTLHNLKILKSKGILESNKPTQYIALKLPCVDKSEKEAQFEPNKHYKYLLKYLIRPEQREEFIVLVN